MNIKTVNLYKKFTGVIELKSKDFKIENKKVKVINPLFVDKYGLIVFYAPWCYHCQEMVEMWSDLAIQFKYKFILGAVNCEKKENYPIRNKLRIKLYPTIKYVGPDGILKDYKGICKKDDIMFFICSKIDACQ